MLMTAYFLAMGLAVLFSTVGCWLPAIICAVAGVLLAYRHEVKALRRKAAAVRAKRRLAAVR